MIHGLELSRNEINYPAESRKAAVGYLGKRPEVLRAIVFARFGGFGTGNTEDTCGGGTLSNRGRGCKSKRASNGSDRSSNGSCHCIGRKSMLRSRHARSFCWELLLVEMEELLNDGAFATCAYEEG